MAFNYRRGGSGALSGAAAGSAFGPWGAAAGGLLGGLGGFGDDGTDEAMGYLDKIPGQQHQLYDPYVNAGNWSLGQLRNQYGSLMSDPSALIKKIGSGYKESPGFQNRLKQGLGAVGNANAAGGLTGTPQHMQQGATMAEDLASEDYDKYMKNSLDLYGMGLQGTQHMGDLGYNASSSLADNLAQTMMSKSNLAYGAGHNQDQMFGGALGNFAGMFGGGGGGASKNWFNR